MNLNTDLFDNGYLVVNKPVNRIQMEEIALQYGNTMPTSFLSEGVYDKAAINDKYASHVIGHTSEHSIGSNLGWHQDYAYREPRYYGLILFGLKNSHIVDTHLCNLRKLFDSFNNSEKRFLRECSFLHVDPTHSMRYSTPRPLVEKHPITNAEVLNFSPFGFLPESYESKEYKMIMERVSDYTTIIKWKDRKFHVIIDNYQFMHKTEKSKEYWNENPRRMLRIQFDYSNVTQ